MSSIIYADELVIDRTIAELHGALEKSRLERKKSLGLSIKGPEVKIEEQRSYRPLTLAEKVVELRTLLNGAASFSNGRRSDKNDAAKYIEERLRAVRVVVPGVQNGYGFSFWLSPATQRLGQLCLFEGRGSDSENPFNYAQSSTYTILQSLVHFAREQRRAGVLDQYISNSPHPNPHAKTTPTHPPSLVEQFHNVERFCYDFYTDPEGLLRGWNCGISTSREINAIYQVREYGPEAAVSFRQVSMFAYALVVEDAA